MTSGVRKPRSPDFLKALPRPSEEGRKRKKRGGKREKKRFLDFD
jgi:hypothetical protein